MTRRQVPETKLGRERPANLNLARASRNLAARERVIAFSEIAESSAPDQHPVEALKPEVGGTRHYANHATLVAAPALNRS